MMTQKELMGAISAAMDAGNPITRDFAAEIASAAPGSYNIGQVCLLWDHLAREFAYVSDPMAFEYVSPASRTIQAGLVGDCDDLAILTAACVEAIGGFARVVAAYAPPSGHAYAECYIGSQEYAEKSVLPMIQLYYAGAQTIHCHRDPFGLLWMNLDALLGRKHPGALIFQGSRESAAYSDGTFETLRDEPAVT